MTDRNHRSTHATKAAELWLAWNTSNLSRRATEEERRELGGLIFDVHVSAEMLDAAGHFRMQLERIPLSAPNRTVADQLRDLTALALEWQEMKSHLGGRTTEAA